MIAGQISLKTMQVRQSKPPYRLSAQARLTIVCSVLLTWLSVVGMSLSIMGAGAVIDGGGSELILWGVILTFATIMIRTMVVARGHIAEESRIRHRIIDAVFTSGPVDSTGAVVSLATESSEKMMALRVGFVGQVIASLTAPLVVLGVISTMSGRIALILLGMLVIVPLLICGFRKIISTVSSGSQDARKALAAAYMDALKSLSTLQLLGAAGRISDQLAATGERNRQAVMRLLKGNQLILFVMDAAFYLAVVTTTAYLVLSSTTLTTGQAVAIMGLSILLLEPMDQVGAFFYVGMSGLAPSVAFSASSVVAARRAAGTFPSTPTRRPRCPSPTCRSATTTGMCFPTSTSPRPRRAGGDHRAERPRQIHAPGPHGWRPHSPKRAGHAAGGVGKRGANHLAVHRHHRRQPAYRPPRRHRGRHVGRARTRPRRRRDSQHAERA